MKIRTGKSLGTAIAIFAVSAAAVAQTDVWLDVDPATGMYEKDVDDGLAMIQAFHSPELRVWGISVVYGNSPLDMGVPIAEEVVSRFGPKRLKVFPGADSAEDFGKRTKAVKALARNLERRSMTILALGPLTNVGTLVQLYPELHGRIHAIVAVAGRRQGQIFSYDTAEGRSFSDFNFEKDPAAMEAILQTDIELVFAPWEVSSHIWITNSDLDRLAGAGGSGPWIAKKSRSWVHFWISTLKTTGFNPFDTLAVAWVTHPQMIEEMEVGAWIDYPKTPDASLPPLLLVDADTKHKRRATYTYLPDPGLKEVILGRLK